MDCISLKHCLLLYPYYFMLSCVKNLKHKKCWKEFKSMMPLQISTPIRNFRKASIYMFLRSKYRK